MAAPRTRTLVAHYLDDDGVPRALKLAAPPAKPAAKILKLLAKKGFAAPELVDWTGRAIDGATPIGAVATVNVAIRCRTAATGRAPLVLDAAALGADALATLVELGVHALRVPVVVRRATAGFDLDRWTATLVERLRKRAARDAQFVFRARGGGSSKKETPSFSTFREVFDDRVRASTHARSGLTMCELSLQREPDLLARVLGALPLDACRPAWAPRGANLFESAAFPELLRPPPFLASGVLFFLLLLVAPRRSRSPLR